MTPPMSSNTKPIILLPYSLDGNIYIRELGRAYQSVGCDVVYGKDNFIEYAIQPDLIHIHWPELFRYLSAADNHLRAVLFLDALRKYKQNGAQLVWTIHNLTPHENTTHEQDALVYQGLINHADLIVHHCSKSKESLAELYAVSASTAQIIIPHGHYFAYPSGVTQPEARRWLGIPDDAFVYLHFGNIRTYKGLDDLYLAFRQVRAKNKWLLIAGQYQSISGSNGLHDKALLWAMKHLSRRISLSLFSIPDERIQYFMAASDCVVLSHRRGLNSGVAILGMTFGKPVVGPDIGCVKDVLDAGINIIYKSGDMKSMVNAMDHAVSINAEQAAIANRKAATLWTWTSMANQILEQTGFGSKINIRTAEERDA